MLAYSHVDALKIHVSDVEVRSLGLRGSLPGIVPLLAAGRCGPGVARLRQTGSGGAYSLSFRAPGSSAYGPPVALVEDGTLLACDGADASKFLRFEVHVSYLRASVSEADLVLEDRFNNSAASDDVTAAEASAGDAETYTLTLENRGAVVLSNLCAWLDPLTPNLEISDDGATWVAPTGQAAALALPDLAPAATTTLYLRRTIAAGTLSDPSVLTHLHLFFTGL